MLEQMLEGEIPADVLFKANLTREQEYALLDAGAIVDLALLIDTYMPNLSALLEENPEWRETIALEDGRIASLPLINRTERQVCVWIHTGWLEKLGLEMPETVDELTQTLAVIRDSDANGNGEHDEIAADLTGVYEMRWLLPYFGIVADDYNLARDAQGNLVFAPELPEYRDFIALLKSWMEQGILREDAFTALHSAQALSGEEEEVAHSGLLVSLVPYTQVPAEEAVQYDALLVPGPDGADPLAGSAWRGLYGLLCGDERLPGPGAGACLGRCALCRRGRSAGLCGRGRGRLCRGCGWALVVFDRRLAQCGNHPQRSADVYRARQCRGCIRATSWQVSTAKWMSTSWPRVSACARSASV